MFQFQQKLKNLKYHLKRWNLETFGNIFKAQQDLMADLANLHQQVIKGGHMEATLEKEQSIHKQLEERRKQEEILWKENSRIRWLKEEERILSSFTKQWYNEECTTTSPSSISKAEHG